MRFEFVANDGCDDLSGVAVVIDVLRAFSFAAFALDAGIERLILMEDLDETLALVATIPGALAGKDGVPQDGFDLFNSPGQLLERADLTGRTIVHRTGAGTIGAVAARGADDLACAEYLQACLEGDQPDPAPFLRRVEVVGEGLRRGVELGYRGVHVDDVTLCTDVDRFDFAMRARDEDGLLTLRRL